MSTTPPGKDKGIIPMTPGVQIPAAVGLAVLIFISITGNAMTVLAYMRDKQLRSVNDLYLFNLGITDLLISAISLPFYTVYTLTMIVAAFCLFWSPMAFTTVLISFCDDCLNQSLYVVFYYLVWVKSSVNPFLYAYNSPRYRMNFQRFLSCNGRIQFRKREHNVKSEFSPSQPRLTRIA